MKNRKSLYFRNEIPTEGQALAEFEELLFSLSHSLINFTVKDAADAARIFFAPAVQKTLKRAEADTRTIGALNAAKRRKADANSAHYHSIVRKLYAEKPHLKRASRHRLAQLVREAMLKQGVTVSAKTIERALPRK